MLTSTPAIPPSLSLEDYLLNPLEHTEWVDGQLVEKNGTTLKTSHVQSRLNAYWRNFKDTQNPGGEVYIKPPCRTGKQIRRPDVAYLTPELQIQFGNLAVLPQSFPLIAEIVSPTDLAEEVFSKANEYLASGCEEVWLLLPDSQWIVTLTSQGRLLFAVGEVARTTVVLPGFQVAVDDLFS